MNERLLYKTEKAIIAGIMKIKNGKISPVESGVPRMLNAIKKLDEPLYDELLEKYKKAIGNI